jgi:hypothetical protein
MTKFLVPLVILVCIVTSINCSPNKPTPEATPPATNAPAKESENTVTPADTAKRKEQFNQMQKSMHEVAAIPTSKLGFDHDFLFVLPSDDWEKSPHGAGDRKSSVWLFKLKKSGLKVLISCAGEKEAPEFSKSAQSVFDSAKSKAPDSTREWKVGNFTLRRSFIGYIDERHGEVTITAFSPICVLEFNIASDSLDRDELFKIADSSVEEFITKNPSGGFPAK